MMKQNELIAAMKSSEDKLLSVRENMINYCVKEEKMQKDEAEKAVNDIISAGAEFKKNVEKFDKLPEEELGAALKALLREKLAGADKKQADELLSGIYEVITDESLEAFDRIAGTEGNKEMKEQVSSFRAVSMEEFKGKSEDERLDLIMAALESASGLVSLSIVAGQEAEQDEAPTEKKSTNANYEALAEYILARKGESDSFTPESSAYEIGAVVSAKNEIEASAQKKCGGRKAIKIISRILAVTIMVALTVCVAMLMFVILSRIGLGALLGLRRFLKPLLMAGVAVGLISFDRVFVKPIDWMQAGIEKLLCKLTGTPYNEEQEQTESNEEPRTSTENVGEEQAHEPAPAAEPLTEAKSYS